MWGQNTVWARRVFFVLALLLCLQFQSAIAADQPLAERIEQTNQRVFTNLAKASHVFGYRFRVLEQGFIEQVGGYFSGAKSVVIVNDSDQILASASVTGNALEFIWTTLAEPLSVESGQSLRVLVRTGIDQSSAAVWSVSLPFRSAGIEVLSLEQGWSSSADPQVWVQSAQTLPEQQARGLVDIGFVGADDSDPPPETPANPDPEEPSVPLPPVAGDPFPETAGVIDSFGQAAPSGALGMGFMAARAYYENFPRKPGECSVEVHDRYWVKDPSGVTHPTWHPPVDPLTGCHFAHEHGDDPRGSPIYAFSQGVAFGITHGNSNGVIRHEDHVGHKVVVQNEWGLVDGNPQNGTQPFTDVVRRTGITCHWLSKLHQGSWSRDALANNTHEYLLNLHCTDGVQLRLKQLVTFGPPELVTNMCNNPAVGQADALSSPDNSSEAFPSGVAATAGIPVATALDGKREFACINNLLWKDQLEELWKSDGVIEFPGGGYINFSPYYVVFNPARYIDHQWVQRGAPDAYVSTLDLCFDDNRAYRDQLPRFCDEVPAELGFLNSSARQQDARNPMNGTQRVIHPKSMVVYTANEAGNGNLITFCTSRLGRQVRIAEPGSCTVDEIEQLVSRSDRRQWGWNGSDVNASRATGQLRGAGYLNEWVRDFSAPGIRFPN